MDINGEISRLKTEVDELKSAYSKLDTQESDKEILKLQKRILKLIEEDQEVHKELLELEADRKNLRSEFIVYQKAVLSAIKQREKNIDFLQDRLSAVESSTAVQVSKVLKKGFKKPLTMPRQSIKAARIFLGGVKRKLRRRKKNLRRITLPYQHTALPPSPFREEQNQFDGVEIREFNELFLIGKYDTPRNVKELRVAGILDEFSYKSFQEDCKIITFRPDNWLEVFTKELPHMLLVESAWKGNGGSWQYKIAEYQIDQGSELDQILKWCSERNIPTVFWNKEDPVHFEKFKKTAKKFDVILTSDENCIPKYKEIAGHNEVYSMSFAAQPKIHNPIKVEGYKSKNICFAGSYYANRHEDRKKDLDVLLDASMRYGLDIFDRNHGVTGSENAHLRFPERFKNNIKGSLPYQDLVKEYKKYKVFLNVNSVQDSNTMFSRRVYELLACGTTILSTYSKGVKENFGNIIPIATTSEEAVRNLESLINNEENRKKSEIEGQRSVLNQHTYAHRLYYIAQKCGFKIEKPYDYKVIIFAKVTNTEELENIITNYKAQLYKNKRLVIVDSNHIGENKNHDKDISFISDKELKTLKVNNAGYNADLIGFMDSSCFYGPHFITDAVQGFIYSNSDIIGKKSHYQYYEGSQEVLLVDNEEEYSYCDNLVAETSVFSCEFINDNNINIQEIVNKQIKLQSLFTYGARLFAVNSYNFIKGLSKIPDEYKQMIIK